MNIAIIGAGNMGGATALGLAGALPDARITVTAKHSSTLEKFAARGLQTAGDNAAAARGADVVILGVKPWLVQSVLEELKPALAGKVLVSFAAGVPAADLSGFVAGCGLKGLYTVIPNLAIEVGESMSFIHELCANQDYHYILTDSDFAQSGDINGSGSLDYHDVILLQKFLTESDGVTFTAAQAAAADLNQDGCIDLRDLFALMQQLEPPAETVSLAELPFFENDKIS